jgi:hypothetical protein
MGEIQHQPISFKKIFGDAINLYKKYYRETIVISILIVLYSIVEREFFTKQLYKESFALWYVTPLLSVVVTTPFYSAGIWYVHQKEEGSDISLLKAFTQSFSRIVSVSITRILYYILLFVGLIIFVVPGILVYVVFSQATYFALLQNKNPKESFSESRKATKGNRLKIFVVIAIDLVLILIVSSKMTLTYGGLSLLSNITWVILTSFSTVLFYGLWRLLVRTPLAKK